MSERLPRCVGAMRGKTPPKELPPIGASVTRWDDKVGIVQEYECSGESQRWFPVKFGAVTSMCRFSPVGANPSSGNGVVRLTSSKVTSINRRKTATEGGTGKAALASSA